MTADGPDERADFFDSAGRFTSIVFAEGPELSFLVSTADGRVGRSLFLKGRRGDIAVVARVMAVLDSLGHGAKARRRTFLDIGANIGTSTVAALCLHGFRSGIACEPDPTNYRLLKLNLVLNGVERHARTLPVAVSQADGQVELALSDRNSGDHRVVGIDGSPGVGGGESGRERITVESVSIDRLIQRDLIEAEEVGLLWIDTQGHEGHVLRGAKSLARHGVPVVLEFYPHLLDRTGGMALIRHVARSGYTHFTDMREVKHSAQLDYELRPIRELEDLAAVLRKDGRFTDILLVNLPRDAR